MKRILEKNNDSLKNNLIDIIKIPHSSGNEDKIINFFESESKKLNIKCIRDINNNLIIEKINDINNGKFVIVQGHLDMVYAKSKNSIHEYDRGILPKEKNGFLYSVNTSLGADNGVALAYILELMRTNDELLPNLRFILTSEEEIGLVGAKSIDKKYFDSDYLINLDTEEEGTAFIGCAGGVRSLIEVDIRYDDIELENYENIIIEIAGLLGGHSGIEISKIRGNAIKYLSRLVKRFENELLIYNINSDGKANAISNYAIVKAFIKKDKFNMFLKEIKILESEFKNEISPQDSIEITAYKVNLKKEKIYSKDTINKLTSIIELMPQGVISNSPKINNFVQSSSNIGKLVQKDNKLIILSSSRSGLESELDNIVEKIKIIAELNDSNVSIFNRYKPWEIKSDSKLLKIAADSYKKLTGKNLVFKAIHAGLECGCFHEKNPKIDMISIGPNIYNAHTTKEKCDIDSFYRTWEFLYEILKNIKANFY